MLTRNNQHFNKGQSNSPVGFSNLPVTKVLFFAHLLIFLVIAFIFMVYIFHSYRQGLYPAQYPFRDREGQEFSRGYYGVPETLPLFGPGLLLLSGWGMGLILHFLGVFVFANRIFPDSLRYEQEQKEYYRSERPNFGQPSRELSFNDSHNPANRWPPPFEPGAGQLEADWGNQNLKNGFYEKNVRK